VSLSVRVQRRSIAADYQLNTEVLLGYQEQLSRLGGVDAVPPLDRLLALPGVVVTPEAHSADPEVHWPAIQGAVEAALAGLAQMRNEEGDALAADLRSHAAAIAAGLGAVEERAPQIADAYRDKLQERVGQTLERVGVSLEPSDLVREVALFVDKSDISEETVRLRSHLEQFEATIAAAGDSAEGVGRKLEFIAQEMGREVNTIGSKANDSELSAQVVEMKAALERVREQVQNVE
ncbi:MAG: DUF1732 domain-containing protein, partial [Planctomycetota bacterium]